MKEIITELSKQKESTEEEFTRRRMWDEQILCTQQDKENLLSD